mmetsp:Transcript_6225/g.15404  ORF Transcript_6225/g.15404 Transcript_6225/m.15404 type:complete len:154 (+) Transcript_6225:113-574(+)
MNSIIQYRLRHDKSMHPLVRSLYKEALFVGRNYPLGLDKVRKEWKKAIRNPKNCPSCYNFASSDGLKVTLATPKKLHSKDYPNPACERELRKAVGKGRYIIREMIGVIQLKKYRILKRRYGDSDIDNDYDPIAIIHKHVEKISDNHDSEERHT